MKRIVQLFAINHYLLEQCLADLKAQGIVGFHLITACEGVLPAFYERFGFKKEERVMLKGKE